MRLLASFLALALACVLGCAGDSSSVMSVWNDGGPGGSAAGQGGSIVGSGGTGGGVGSGTLAVEGGIRDLATTQCTVTSGATCPWPAETLTCIKSQCSAELTKCYYSDGVSAAAGGTCQDYANCMLKCPCTAARGTCEDSCRESVAAGEAGCNMCLFDLFNCATDHGCPPPTTCTVSSGGAGGGSTS